MFPDELSFLGDSSGEIVTLSAAGICISKLRP